MENELEKLKCMVCNLPESLSISTMTLTCNFDVTIYKENMRKYLPFEKDGLIGIDRSNGFESSYKNKKKQKKINKREMQNQITTEIYCSLKKNKKINVKFFKNGSLHITGCSSLEILEEIINTSKKILSKEMAILKIENGKKVIVDIPFVSDISKLDLKLMSKVDISMINSNFEIEMKIDRLRLEKKLLEANINAKYAPETHAGVIIKHKYNDNEDVSIFVFQSGSIIITGALHRNHIISSYIFITKFLYENYNEVVYYGFDDFLLKYGIDKTKLWREELIKKKLNN